MSERPKAIVLQSISCPNSVIGIDRQPDDSKFAAGAKSACNKPGCNYSGTSIVRGKLRPNIAEDQAKVNVEMALIRRGSNPGDDCCLERFGSK